LKCIVVKCGGSAIEKLSIDFFKSIQSLSDDGYHFVFVHGGGPAINALLEQYNLEPEFHNGLRITNEKVMEITEMVLSGQTNRQLVRLLERHKLRAIGLNGSDARMLNADFINKSELGYVGKITSVNPRLIFQLLLEQFVPVITPIAAFNDGMVLNINADYAAAAIAKAVNADKCLFVTDVDGIMVNGSLIASIDEIQIAALIAEGHIKGGMIPKVNSAVTALNEGVPEVAIVSAQNSFYHKGKWKGTSITKRETVEN
jgi:acetylglutamate kinase